MDISKADILAFGAYPDDAECAAVGTISKHIADGKTVGIVDLAAGELGSFGDPETRTIEYLKAEELMGVKNREQLAIPDGNINSSESNRLLVIQAICKYKPDIVIGVNGFYQLI